MILAQQQADKHVYIQAADDPLGSLFLIALWVAVPILSAIGIYRLTERRWAGGAVAVGWWLFLVLFVDVQTGRLVTE